MECPAPISQGATPQIKDQIEHNPQMYAAWANGMIYVDRTDKQNRHDAVSKMEKVINHKPKCGCEKNAEK